MDCKCVDLCGCWSCRASTTKIEMFIFLNFICFNKDDEKRYDDAVIVLMLNVYEHQRT